MKLGVIGCGVMGQRHLAVASELSGVQVAAVADLDGEKAQAAAARFGATRCHTDPQALLADPQVEAVVLATPATGRVDLAEAAMRRGLHVLSEKPAALPGDDLQRLAALSDRAVYACCSSRYRFLPSAEAATQAVADGLIGKVRTLTCRGVAPASPAPETLPPRWRLSRELNGGGVLANWGCYDLDYLLGVAGGRLQPQSVTARCWSLAPTYRQHVPPGADAETHAHVMVGFAGGVSLMLERAEYVPMTRQSCWWICGDAGAIELSMVAGEGKQLTLRRASAEQGVEPQVLWSGDDPPQVLQSGPLTDFVQAVQTGRPPRTGLAESLTLQQLLAAAYDAARRGETVRVEPAPASIARPAPTAAFS